MDGLNSVFKNVSLRTPRFSTPLPNENGDDDPAAEGNKFFAQKNYSMAIESYTKALKKNPNLTKLFSNRALAFLKIRRFESALRDAETGLRTEATNVKLLYRKGKALLGMEKFSDAVLFLRETKNNIETAKKNEVFSALLQIAERMKNEHENGVYDLLEMMDESKTSKFLENHADFYDGTAYKIRQIPGKGRGVVAKKNLPAGTLLMACKAFVFAEKGEGVNIHWWMTHTSKEFRFTPLVEKAREKLKNCPQKEARDFYRLYAGRKLGFLTEIEQNKSLDTERICNVIRWNTFGAQIGLGDTEIEDAGLWIRPSYFNHSCVDTNCDYYMIGDFMFVRTNKVVARDEELIFGYMVPTDIYEKRKKWQEDFYGFRCQCRLCELEKKEPESVRGRFLKFEQIIADLKGTYTKGYNAEKAIILENILKEAVALRGENDLNLTAMKIRLALSAAIFEVKPLESLRLIVESYEICQRIGLLPDAMQLAMLLAKATLKEGENFDQLKYANEAKELAKIICGDERMVDLIQDVRILQIHINLVRIS